MLLGTITTRARASLPKLAVTALICWSLGANTHVDAANTSFALPPDVASLPSTVAPTIQVLSDHDADLYRAIFAAQDKADWKAADELIAGLNDKGLMGHVLAERYQKHEPNARDLKSWLAKYADLPEAAGLYQRALSLAPKGARIEEPASAGRWTGGSGYSTSFGFRPESTAKEASRPAARRLLAVITHDLRHGRPVEAERRLEDSKRHVLSPADAAGVQALIAARYFYDGQSQHARHLADAVAKSGNPLALWIGGLTAWQQNDSESSAAAFAHLATVPGLSSWDRAAAEFWAGRAYRRLGDDDRAAQWFAEAAQKPHSFYGLLATQLLDRDLNWSWKLPKLNDRHIAILAKQKAGWRALALLQIGQKALAENELRHLNPQGRRDLQEAMLALAEAAHMPSLAMQLGGMATRADGTFYDAALYPLPPWQPTHGFEIDRALLYALMRRESQFNPKAVSDRGACGLMQLMPATARTIARETGAREPIGHACTAHLLDPAVNMALGQEYVRDLAGQPAIGDNLVMLLAAYNGGPGKLAHWRHDSSELQARLGDDGNGNGADPLLFLESLPARQTHDYVEQVLMHYWIYRARLDEPETSLVELAHGQWPRYQPSTYASAGLDQAAADIRGAIQVASSQSR